MKIYSRKNTFTCFGCNAHGDVIDLVAQIERCDKGKAISIINTVFKLGLDSDLSWTERKKYAEMAKQRKEQAMQRKAHEKYRIKTLIKIANYLHSCEYIAYRFRYGGGILSKNFYAYVENDMATWYYWKTECDRLEWLYDTISGININENSQYYYIYGGSQTEILKNIKNGKIEII